MTYTGVIYMLKNILTQGVCLEDRYIPDYDKLRQVIRSFKDFGWKISMTQGVFDLLHPGHTRYLAEAKSHGDVLVVAVDSDEYTRLRKQRSNERRPVVPFEERLEILASLRSVDVLTIRDVKEHSGDPYCVIKVVNPDALVVSRSTKDVTEKDYEALREFCGQVVILDPQATISTTKRLLELLTDGATGLVDHLMTAIEDYFQPTGREIVFKKGNGNGNA